MANKQETVQLRNMNNTGQSPGGASNFSDNDDYDPHIHRDNPKATNNFETLIHLLKCSIGTGILAMPQAFARSGLITGVIATIIVGIIITYCLHMLVHALYVSCKRKRVPLLSYTESMKVAILCGPPSIRGLARPIAIAVDVFLVVYQLGICCVYIVFIARNLKQLCDAYINWPVEIYMLIILIPLIGFNCIRNLKLLAPWSTVANLMTFIGLGMVVYYLLSGKKSDEPLDLWGSIFTFPLFFGTILFALTTVGVVIALEANMKTPKSFGGVCGVLNVGMTIIVLMYLAMGIIGYIFCVSQCSDSITLDLPQTEALAIAIKILYALAILISYGLQCYVPVDVLWNGYLLRRLNAKGASEKRKLVMEYMLRIGLCLLTFVVAAAVPRLGLFISLFGALCLSALGIIFPSMMEMCLSYPDKFGPGRIKLIKDVLLFIFGVIGLLVGTYTALLAIVRSFGTTAAPTTTPASVFAFARNATEEFLLAETKTPHTQS